MKEIIFYDAMMESIGERKLPSSLDHDLRHFSEELEKVKTVDATQEIVEKYETKRLRKRLWDAINHDAAVAYDDILKELIKNK